MKKKASIFNRKALEGMGITAGSTAATSITPKYVGYKEGGPEGKEGGSNKSRAAVMGIGAGATALAFNPRRVVPKPILKHLLRRGHKNKINYFEKRSPTVGAVWGAGSGLLSYETGRKAKDLKNKYDMEKKAGMIDPIQETLEPDIYDEDGKMYPELTKYIRDTLATKISLDKVEAMLSTGALTGLQYNDGSDVDISVYIKNPPKEWEGSGKSSLVGDISHIPLPGTKRTFQYYVLPWDKNTRRGLRNREFGLYDVMNDKWHTPPRPREDYTPPEVKFKSEFIMARHMARNLDRKVMAFRKYIKNYKSYKKGRYTNANWSPTIMLYHKRKAQHAWKDLVEFCQSVYIGRHHRYSLGWGVPRNAQANVNFKLLEYGPHFNMFDKASKWDLPDRVEDIKLEKIDLEKTEGTVER